MPLMLEYSKLFICIINETICSHKINFKPLKSKHLKQFRFKLNENILHEINLTPLKSKHLMGVSL